MFFEEDELPRVSVLMSLYNEESVIAEKLESLTGVDYPEDKICFFIGSDCSGDQTNDIVQNFAKGHSNIRFFPFKERRGKASVVNDLVDSAYNIWKKDKDHIIIITDASVMLRKEVIINLVRHFKNPEIDLVDAHMVHFGMSKESISETENQYISSEVQLKYREGLLWKAMIGPFGGCYAVRSTHFSKIPANRLVDDFYIAMKVFEKGGGAINDLEAVCEEAVSHDLWVEYKRKARIAAGSFQNMLSFVKLWWPPFKPLQFAFFSHKILRWLGPFFLLFQLISSGYLGYSGNQLYELLFYCQLAVLVGIPVVDFIFKKLNINVLYFRHIAYFVFMNIALFQGFFKYAKGIKSGTWSPTKRQQQ